MAFKYNTNLLLLVLTTLTFLATASASNNFTWGAHQNWNFSTVFPFNHPNTTSYAFNHTTVWPFNHPNTTCCGFNHSAGVWPFNHPNTTRDPNRINVGGSENWRFGYNYTEWGLKNGPFYLNDTLVFKYDPPSNTNTHPHSVYLLPSYWSFLNCDLRYAKLVANITQGGGEGFQFVLGKWKPYYFACGESNGFHCQSGMKFFVMPMFR